MSSDSFARIANDAGPTGGLVPSDTAVGAERRRAPRVSLLGELYGHIVTLDIPVAVRDMSLTGLLIETPVAFPLGAVHQFSLMLGDGSVVILRGRVVRCQPMRSNDGVDWYESGIALLDDAEVDATSSQATAS